MQKYKIGIVGGSGFVGYSLAKHLASSFDVKILDVKKPKEMLISLEYEYCDIRNYENVQKALLDVDLVIHAAIIQIPTINELKRLGYEVNFLGTHNVCKAVDENQRIKGMILASSWHTIGERGVRGVVNEEFGYRPDKVEDRARLYVLSKIAQETIVRYYDEMSEKIYVIIRIGTVLGEGMPEKTAANIFIERGLKGETLTPYKHSMYRPMLYVDIRDVCRAYEIFATKILYGEIVKEGGSLSHVLNIIYPEPITILELAEIIRDSIQRLTEGRLNPEIEIVDKGLPILFSPEDKTKFKIDISKAINFLGLRELNSPKKVIEELIKKKYAHNYCNDFY